MYRLSIKLLTPILLIALAATILAFSSSAQRLPHTSGFLKVGPGGGSARFEVTLFRFIVNHETWDDTLERDGKRDEVSFSRVAILHNRMTGSRVLSDGLNFTQTMGESPPNAVRAGHASSLRGGLKTGDDIVMPHVMLFSEELIQGESAATIIVSVWEMDGPRDLYEPYKNFLENSQPDMQRIALGTLRNSPQLSVLVRDWDTSFTSNDPMGIPATANMPLTDGPVGLGDPKDRPIGMVKRGARYDFVPKLLILNFDNASRAAQTNQGLGLGVIKITYTDADKLAGNYTLYVKIRRL